MKFNVYGHENIQGKHKTTLEFTKDPELSLKGDCIIGVKADFDLEKLKKFIKDVKRIKMTLETGNLCDELEFDVNPEFSDPEEIVIRMGDFKSKRTLGIKASRSAKMIKREIIDLMKFPKQRMVVKLEKADQ